MESFNFTDNKDLLFYEVVFNGELKGGLDFISDKFQKLVKQIKAEAESRIVFLDISSVTFWDTEGMRQILGLASNLNQKLGGNRVYVIAPRDEYLFNRAKEKYKDHLDKTVPWKSSKEGLI